MPPNACGDEKFRAVYLNAIGCAAQHHARCIKEAKQVQFMEFGLPGALWNIVIEDFPAVVTMDFYGTLSMPMWKKLPEPYWRSWQIPFFEA